MILNLSARAAINQERRKPTVIVKIAETLILANGFGKNLKMNFKQKRQIAGLMLGSI